jgi:membrane associated rhomboid family serine protease
MNTQRSTSGSGWASGALVLLGPALSIIALHLSSGGTYLPDEYTWLAFAVALVAWSPLPFAVPALVLQDARDAYAPNASTIQRGRGMLPHLLSTGGSVSVVTAASLAGLTGGLVVALIASS